MKPGPKRGRGREGVWGMQGGFGLAETLYKKRIEVYKKQWKRIIEGQFYSCEEYLHALIGINHFLAEVKAE